jgi:hypothetical protein
VKTAKCQSRPDRKRIGEPVEDMLLTFALCSTVQSPCGVRLIGERRPEEGISIHLAEHSLFTRPCP